MIAPFFRRGAFRKAIGAFRKAINDHPSVVKGHLVDPVVEMVNQSSILTPCQNATRFLIFRARGLGCG